MSAIRAEAKKMRAVMLRTCAQHRTNMSRPAPPPSFSAGNVYRDGDAVMALIRRGFAKIDAFDPQEHQGGRGRFQRTRQQRAYHEAIIDALLRVIYSTDFAGKMGRIMRERDLREIYQEVMIVATRRFGKTMGTAMAMAVFLWAIPNFTECIFSTGQRASKSMLDLVEKFFTILCDGDIAPYVIRKNHEEFMVRNPHQEQARLDPTAALLDYRLCKSLPATVSSPPLTPTPHPHPTPLLQKKKFFQTRPTATRGGKSVCPELPRCRRRRLRSWTRCGGCSSA